MTFFVINTGITDLCRQNDLFGNHARKLLIQNERIKNKSSRYSSLKEGEPDFFKSGSYMEGQLKERSESGQAQWQTALEEELAAGSR